MRIHEWAAMGLFFGAGAFFAGVFGLTTMCVLAVLGLTICELLALYGWNERERYREMRRDIGGRQEAESVRLARGIQEGCEWDAKGGGAE